MIKKKLIKDFNTIKKNFVKSIPKTRRCIKYTLKTFDDVCGCSKALRNKTVRQLCASKTMNHRVKKSQLGSFLKAVLIDDEKRPIPIVHGLNLHECVGDGCNQYFYTNVCIETPKNKKLYHK